MPTTLQTNQKLANLTDCKDACLPQCAILRPTSNLREHAVSTDQISPSPCRHALRANFETCSAGTPSACYARWFLFTALHTLLAKRGCTNYKTP